MPVVTPIVKVLLPSAWLLCSILSVRENNKKKRKWKIKLITVYVWVSVPAVGTELKFQEVW